MIYFITGSEGKFREAKAILPELGQLDIDLPEIQHIDPKEVIKAKLIEARKHHNGEFIVEDTGLYFDCLNGLPGPLIKWFMKTLDNEGLANLVQKLGNNTAKAKTVIGYASGERMEFFEGTINGRIVTPAGDQGFGWDPIFQPEGFDKTFAQMDANEKNKISMRRIAFENLKRSLG